jgi:hypothetical protein
MFLFYWRLGVDIVIKQHFEVGFFTQVLKCAIREKGILECKKGLGISNSLERFTSHEIPYLGTD